MNYIDLQIDNFSLDNTFLNGQCFRWNKTSNNAYIGVVKDKVYEILKLDDSTYRVCNADEPERTFFENYLDINNKYTQIEYYVYNYDDILKKSVTFGSGMHLLKQDVWETTISFILSIQKNIPAIKKTIEHLSMLYGKEIKYKGNIYYTFPTSDVLKDSCAEDVMQCKCGFRAKGVIDAARKIYSKEVNLNSLSSLTDNSARAELKKICGIGEKVADCILLFSLSRYNSCPIDTWVKAGLDYFYNANKANESEYRNFAYEKWKENTGFAQQYLFHYLRNNYVQDKINKNLIKREENAVYKSIT
ncbi:MAG: DNA glycosylase [Eubacteriaceae bacterium]|nr:DNA glycosylase [Eubacteriaceae bacterium]